jgi:hypothetical protein
VSLSLDRGDHAGTLLAAVCALHCLAAPLLATYFHAGGAVTSERAELALVASSLLVSGVTILAGCLRRTTRRIVWAAFLSSAPDFSSVPGWMGRGQSSSSVRSLSPGLRPSSPHMP